VAASGTRPGGQGPDTIFAVASGFGRSAICVIRLSGPDSLATLATLTGRPAPPARALTLRTLRGPDTGEPLDQAMVVWLPGPGSHTTMA
jgi:tRNA modification GTPase